MYLFFVSGSNMDAEAALLEESPTMSTISSSDSDQTYPETEPPYSRDSSIMVTPMYKKIREEELTPRPIPRHSTPPRKPKFSIRPPYLMICISIIEVIIKYYIFSYKIKL